MVAIVAGLFAVIEAGRAIGWNAGDALLLHHFGVGPLPYLYIAAGMISSLVLLSYTAGLARFNPGRFFTVVLLALGGVLGAYRVALSLGFRAGYPLAWLVINVLCWLLGTLLWSVAVEVTDQKQPKRLFPLFASAGILGGVAGNLMTEPFEAIVGTDNLLLLFAALLLVGGVLTGFGVTTIARPAPRSASHPAALSHLASGLEILRRSQLIRSIAYMTALVSVLYWALSFSFGQAVSTSFDSDGEIAAFMGRTSAVATGTTFLISLLLVNRLFARFGVASVAIALPIAYVAGFGLIAADLSLAAAVLARVSQISVHVGIGITATNTLFNAVPREHRSAALSFNASVPKQLGIVLSGTLLLFGSHNFDTRLVPLAGILLSLVCVALVLRIRGLYGAAPATSQLA